MPDVHAILGASSAHRWMVCTPSAQWEREFPDSTSEAAAEGTVAHAVAETLLNAMLRGKRAYIPKALKENEFFNKAMVDHCEAYRDYVGNYFHNATITLSQVEARVSFDEWVPEGFGTADCLLIIGNTLHVFDFKYGKNVLVRAPRNPQLMLYGLGALAYDLFDEVENVHLHIFQPRMDNISTWTIRKEVLLQWANGEVRPAATLAYAGQGEFRAGEHCRFCRCKYRCQTYRDFVTDTFNEERTQARPNELSDADVAEILAHVDALVSYANGVKEYALQEALNGHDFPGYKLVEGKSNRKITDEAKALDLLNAAGFTSDAVTTTSLLNLTNLEKLVGKAKLAEVLKPVLKKPKGKPALVVEDDPRPVYVNTNFTNIDEEENTQNG